MKRYAIGWMMGPLLVALTTSATQAMEIPIAGGPSTQNNSGLGSFEGSISYDAGTFGDGSGVLTVVLTNTSPANNGGEIAAFLFNVDGNATADYSTMTLESDNMLRDGATLAWADPVGNQFRFEPPSRFGTFEAGEYADPPPDTNGILVGETGTFTFAVTGGGADSLTSESFVSESALNNSGDPTGVVFGARFQGFDDGGSDTVQGVVVPLPAPVLMAGLGLAGIFVGRKRLARLL